MNLPLLSSLHRQWRLFKQLIKCKTKSFSKKSFFYSLHALQPTHISSQTIIIELADSLYFLYSSIYHCGGRKLLIKFWFSSDFLVKIRSIPPFICVCGNVNKLCTDYRFRFWPNSVLVVCFWQICLVIN